MDFNFKHYYLVFKYDQYNFVYFSMLKSPVKSFPVKKPPVNLIKPLIEPKQAHRALKLETSKSISTIQNEASFSHFNHHPSINTISLEVIVDKPTRILKLQFPYSSETSIQQLIAFLTRQLSETFICFTTKDINSQYFLTLPHRKVAQLGLNKLQLAATKIKIDRSGHFLNNLEIVKCLGTGGFSKVYLVRGYGKLMAMKVINKTFILSNEKQNIIENERTILQKCSKHPFITQLYLGFETQSYLIFCMEYCHGGELFNLLRRVRRMKEEEAKFYFLQTLAAISHLHSQNILYRDLKPENIIIDSEGHLRLADYGLSKIMRENMTYSFCGSAEYMAPQMLLKYHCDKLELAMDLKQITTVLGHCSMNCQLGCLHTTQEIKINYLLQFPPGIPLSQEIKSMLRRLLQKDTDLRFKNVQEIFSCPYLQGSNLQDILAKRLIPPFKTNMFQQNFDCSDFGDEHKEVMKLKRQRDLGRLPQEEVCFPYFGFINEDLLKLDQQMEKSRLKRLNFSKKPSGAVLAQQASQQQQISWRNNRSMKSIDSSQFYINQHQAIYSPRVTSNYNKFKVFSSQTSQILAPSSPTNPKASQIITTIQFKSKTPSKLTKGVSVAQPVQKVKMGFNNFQRFGSPININNYINIYTSKSPSYNQLKYKLNDYFSPQAKKSYANGSYDKAPNNHINSSYKNTSNPTLQTHKQKVVPSQSANNLQNNVYLQNGTSLNSRGYLSNFKERFNPNQKIKKSYKTNERLNFNFYTPHTPYKQI